MTGRSTYPSNSEDGNCIVFQSTSPQLVPGNSTTTEQTLLWKRVEDSITVLSRHSDGSLAEQNSGPSYAYAVSGTCEQVILQTYTPFDPSDTNGKVDVYLYDQQVNSGNLQWISVGPNGEQAIADVCYRSSIDNSGNLIQLE